MSKQLNEIFKKYLGENVEPIDSGDPGSDDYHLLQEIVRAEEDTVYIYQGLVRDAKDARAKKVIQDIIDEERVHIFEIQALMKALESDKTREQRNHAAEEIRELVGEGLQALTRQERIDKFDKEFAESLAQTIKDLKIQIADKDREKLAKELIARWTKKR